jgi:hypothetical protein
MRTQTGLSRLVLAVGFSVGSLLGSAGLAAAEADRKVTMELVQMVTPQETYQAMITQMTKQMLASMQQSGANVPAGVEEKMGKAVVEALPYADLASWTVDVYAARFTTEEVRQLIGFYKTPVGKKAARLLPELSGEVGQKMGPILMQRLPAAMKKVGLTP